MRRPQLRSVTAIAALFLGYLATTNLTGHFVNDVPATALASWRLGQFGDLDLTGFETWGWIAEYGTAGVVSNRLPGAVLFGAPFYAVLGEEQQTVFPSAVAAATAATAATVLLYILLRRLTSRRTALMGTAVAVAGTSFWPVAGDALWTHGPATLWLMAGTLAAASSRWWASGLAFGLAVLTRPHLAVVPAVQGIWHSTTQRSVGPALRIGLASLLGALGLLAYHRIIYGSWTVVGGYTGPRLQVTDDPARFAWNVGGTLVSPARGVLLYMPWILLLLPGIPSAWRRSPQWVRAAAVSGVAYLLAQLLLNRFSGGSAFFGNRLVIESLWLAAPFGLIAYKTWTSQRRWARTAFTGLVGLSVTWHALAAISNHLVGGDLNPWLRWEHWELVRGANPYVVAISLVIGLAATGWGVVATWRSPLPGEESLEPVGSALPGPVGGDQLSADGADGPSDVGMVQETAHPGDDR